MEREATYKITTSRTFFTYIAIIDFTIIGPYASLANTKFRLNTVLSKTVF